MGWFLIGNQGGKKGKRSTRGKAKGKGRSNAKATRKWEPEQTLRMLQTAGWSLGVIGAVAGWYYGEQALQEEIAEARSTRPQVVMRDVPVWMSDRIVHQLGLRVVESLDGDPFDQAALQQAALDLTDSAWVHRVQRVARQPGGKIEVVASYREPTALVEQRNQRGEVSGYRLVARNGVCLPAVYEQEHLRQLDLPLIRGVHQPAPEAGEIWPGGDLKAGIALAQIVAAQTWRIQVRAIDVTNYGGRRFVGEAQLKLLTELDDDDDPRNNTGVAWGRAPGDEQFYEPDTATKLANLDQLLRRFSTIDAGGKVVDLFRDVVHIHALTETVNYTVARE